LNRVSIKYLVAKVKTTKLILFQMVNISLRVLSRPDALSIPTIARELGSDYDEKGLNIKTNLKAQFSSSNFSKIILYCVDLVYYTLKFLLYSQTLK
jgi:hypothetical protein